MKSLVQKCTNVHFLKSMHRSLQTPPIQFQDIIIVYIEEVFVYKGSGCILGWEGGTTYLRLQMGQRPI
jgi:hypothetical protein